METQAEKMYSPEAHLLFFQSLTRSHYNPCHIYSKPLSFTWIHITAGILITKIPVTFTLFIRIFGSWRRKQELAGMKSKMSSQSSIFRDVAPFPTPPFITSPNRR